MTDAAALARIDAAEEVEIETRSASGDVHRTIIWAVVDGGDVLVRSYLGPTARWYREALARPEVALHVDGDRVPFRLVRATDPASVERCSAGLSRKYRTSMSLEAMLRPEVLDTTLRLTPA